VNREVKIKSPLGEDVLLFEAMHGEEHLGGGFEYQLSALSQNHALDLSALLGQTITLKVELPKSEFRYFNGYVVSFSMESGTQRHTRYRLVLRPWTHLLSLTSTSRIFQNKAVPDIVKEVFRDAKLTDFRESLNGTYRKLEYSVQYRESDLNYVSRLMEQEGIYTFFEHEDGKHTLVLADSITAHSTFAGYEKVPFFPAGDTNQHHDDSIASWSVGRQMRPGAFSSSDYDFTRPSAKLLTRLKRPMKQGHADPEVYDYPGEFLKSAEGEQHVKVRLDELQASFEVAHADGTVHGLFAGGLFTLEGHPRADQNNEYLVTAASYTLAGNAHEAGEGEGRGFMGSYSCLNSQQQFRAPSRTPRPKVDGPQTATVVGKPGEEISTDQYGRVKVKFHWDLDPARDESSSCWVRVSQVWAGAQWGAMHIPRIGQEVIVDFLEGDPDRPIITGRVYNGMQMPPYGLPENMTQSGIKSRSTPGGTPSNFNEIRFEDKKGKEELHIQAEKDKTVLVKHDRSASVGANDSISVGGDRSVHVTGNLAVTVDGGGKSPNHSSHSVTGKYNLHASDTIEADAPTHIKLTCGGSSILIEPAQITITAGGKSVILMTEDIVATSKDQSGIKVDKNVLAKSSLGGTLFMNADVILESKDLTSIKLDADATTVSKGDVKAGGKNVELSGDMKVTANGGSGGQLELEASGAKLSGPQVGVSGQGMTEITGALVKIN
jgi:type VI secretion system secreted protein VgrG